MRRLDRWLVLMLLTCSLPCRAEMRLLATATSDSYRSLTYGVSAFCQSAGFPLDLADINAQAAQTLLVPGLGGIDVQNNMWLLWLMSDQTNRQERSLSAIAILPTVDQGAIALQSLASTYPSRIWDDERQLWRFTRPTADAPAAGVAPVVYACVVGNNLLVSRARDAVEWARRHPIAPATATAIAIAGQVRIDIQPVTLAALLKAYREQRAGTIDLFNDASERLLSEVRTLSLVIEAATEGVNIQLTLVAIAESPLHARLARMRAPAPMLWMLPPEHSSFAAVNGGLSLLELLESYAPAQTDGKRGPSSRDGCGLTGDSATFIDRAGPTGTICFASALATTNPVATWSAASAEPQAFLPFRPSFTLATNGTRMVRGCPVQDLFFTESRSGGTVTNNPADMAAFMLRDGGLSLAVTTNLLVVTFGPSNAVDYVLGRIGQIPLQSAALPVRCRRLLPDIGDSASAVILLQPVAMVHQVAASLPSMNRDRIASLPQPGDGIAAALIRANPGELRLTLRISANEVSRAQQALKEGRAALQEMFMQMAVQQLLQQRNGPGDPRHRAPAAQSAP